MSTLSPGVFPPATRLGWPGSPAVAARVGNFGGASEGVSHAGIVHGFIAKAGRLGADTIEVEYRDGYEEVSVLKGGVGFGIARFPSMGRRSTALREELDRLRKKTTTKVTVDGADYEVRARTYERFGEQMFEVRLRRL